jgi:uncharacterized protein
MHYFIIITFYMFKKFRNCFYVIFVCFFISCKAQNKTDAIELSKNDNTLLWKISGKGIKPLYIFGTMHLLCSEDAILSTNVKKIMEKVDKIYFELDMDDMGNMLSAFTKMKMNNGIKLKDLLTEVEYNKVKTYFNKKGGMVPFSIMENFKPMLISSTMMEDDMPCEKGISGIEMQMMELNKKAKQKKEILGLEIMEDQLAVFDTIPYKEQAKMLITYMDSAVSTKKETAKLVAAYKLQNLKTIETLISKSEPELEKYTDVLLNNRNKNWVTKFKTICTTKSIIAAVGAGHLVGEQGLLQLLKKEGYIITPLKN